MVVSCALRQKTKKALKDVPSYVKNEVQNTVSQWVGLPREELENRLTGRCTNDTDDIRNRMEIAKREIEIAPLYKYNVVNDDLQRCVDEIDQILNKELLTQNSKEI